MSTLINNNSKIAIQKGLLIFKIRFFYYFIDIQFIKKWIECLIYTKRQTIFHHECQHVKENEPF